MLVASGFRARLLGLAFLPEAALPAAHALVLRPCCSVHTFGMRFPIDVAFADRDGTVLRVIEALQPRSFARCSGASVALEAHAGDLSRFLDSGGLATLSRARRRAARA